MKRDCAVIVKPGQPFRRSTAGGGRGTALGVLLATALIAGCASTPASGPDIEALERARFAAMTRQDVAALDRMLTPDALYCHSTGQCEDKAQFLESIGSGRLRYKEIRLEELRVRPAGDAFIVHGTLTADAEAGGKPVALNLVFTDVYVKRDGAWQMAAWQSTRRP